MIALSSVLIFFQLLHLPYSLLLFWNGPSLFSCYYPFIFLLPSFHFFLPHEFHFLFSQSTFIHLPLPPPQVCSTARSFRAARPCVRGRSEKTTAASFSPTPIPSAASRSRSQGLRAARSLRTPRAKPWSSAFVRFPWISCCLCCRSSRRVFRSSEVGFGAVRVWIWLFIFIYLFLIVRMFDRHLRRQITRVVHLLQNIFWFIHWHFRSYARIHSFIQEFLISKIVKIGYFSSHPHTKK